MPGSSKVKAVINEMVAMKLSRRKLLRLATGAATLPALSRIAESQAYRMATAQAYPMRPITMIVPFPSGGSADAVGRLLAERMRKSLGQPIIIENVGGAGGSIGIGRAAHARPDGYTIVLGGLATQVLNGAFYSLQYDVVNDFAPISLLLTTAYVLFARKTTPARDLIELIDWLKANPNKASAGIVSTGTNLVTKFFQKETGTKFTLVPYRGVAPAVQDLVAGQFDLLLTTPECATADAGRERKGLCGDKRHAPGGGARHPDLCRDGTAGGFLLHLVRAFRAPWRAEGYHWQAQCGGC
jgi:tripartite-type tricarboxylate transporter receptor subunit TctC